MHLLKYSLKIVLGCMLMVIMGASAYSQNIFFESFNESNNAMFGTDNVGGVSWSTYCTTCLTGDYFNVQNGELVGNDTNGEAGWETGIVTISGCQNVEISFTVKENGTLEGCGTGCNSVDWVSLEYNIDGAGYQPAPNSFFCAGACANTEVIFADDITGGVASYSSGCLGSGSTLQFRIKVQTWAQDEFWIIDDIAVNCVGTAATINPVATMCETDAPIQLTASVSGGTWNGTAVSSSGLFDPTVAGPGSHPIFYTTGSGSCAGQTSTSIIVTAAPIVGVITSPATSICEGASTTLNLTSASGTIQWQSAATSNGPFTDIPGANALSLSTGSLFSSKCYRATVAGCGTPAISNVLCITVNPIPNVNAGTDQSVCLGTSVSLSANGATTYSWSNGVTNGVAFSPSLGSTNYTVTGTSTGGCTNTDQVTVVVNSLPNVSAGADVVICPGASVILSGSGAISYTWSGGVTNGQAFIPSNSSTYTVTGTDINGCSASDDVVVTVTALQTIPQLPSISVNCASDVPLADEAAIVAFIDDFVPNPTVVFIGDVSNGNACNNEQITRSYEVTNNCGVTESISQLINIAAQTPTINAGADVSACEGSLVTLNAVSSDATAMIQWDQGVAQGVPFVPNLGSTNYSVSASICGGSCSASDQVLVTVDAGTMPIFTADTTIICQNQMVVFEAQTNNSVACLWDFGNGIQSNSCDGEIVTYTSPGIFDVSLTVTNAAGCTNTAVYPSFIAVIAQPIASFTASSYTISEVNSEIQFNNASENEVSYYWDFGDQTTSIIENPNHQFSIEGFQNYEVSLTVANSLGCEASYSALIQYEESLVYYVPNAFTPDDDENNPVFLPIFNDAIDGYNYELLIFDRWGTVVFESHALQEGWDGTFDGRMMQDGIYIWKIKFKMKNNDDMQELAGHVNLLR